MMRDRDYNVDAFQLITSNDALEVSGNIYLNAIKLNCSLSVSTRVTLTSNRHEGTIAIWSLDRNYDSVKCKDRMISTDQIKYLSGLIAKSRADRHVIICPFKLSPHAKKEAALLPNSEYFLFDELMIDLPRHILVLNHRPISVEEARSVLGQAMSPQDLPVLPLSDPVRKWYSWKKDTIIFIDNPTVPSFRIVC